MLRLKLNNEDMKYICEKNDTDNIFVEKIYNEVSSFYVDVKLQHLASIMRCLEFKGREATCNNNFRIDWGEMRNDSKTAHSMFFRNENRFTISLPKGVENEQARYMVAHELGHLFYLLDIIKILDKKASELDLVEYYNFKKRVLNDEGGLMHKKANIFGALIILERSEFYKKKVPEMEEMINKPLNKIIDQFSSLYSPQS